MLSRGEVNQIVILPDADLVQVQLYPGASLRGAPTKVSRQGLLKLDLQSFVGSVVFDVFPLSEFYVSDEN